MLKDASMISFIIVLIVNFFSNNTVSLFETFMTISTMNTKSGTNGILPHRTKLLIYHSNNMIQKATNRAIIPALI